MIVLNEKQLISFINKLVTSKEYTWNATPELCKLSDELHSPKLAKFTRDVAMVLGYISECQDFMQFTKKDWEKQIEIGIENKRKLNEYNSEYNTRKDADRGCFH